MHWDKDYIIRRLGDVHFAIDFAQSPCGGWLSHEGYEAERVDLYRDRDELLCQLKKYRQSRIKPQAAWPRR